MNNYTKISIYLSLLITVFLILPKLTHAADFYVDPVNGSMSNDGSQAHPWSTLPAVWAAGKIHTYHYTDIGTWQVLAEKYPSGVVHAGDTIYLMSGYNGTLNLLGAVNTDYITIKAYPGEIPTFKNIWIAGAAYWKIEGIKVSTEFSGTITQFINGLIQIENHSNQGPCNHITIKDSEIYSINDDSAWTTLLDWYNHASTGIITAGTYTTIDNVLIRNVAIGVGLQSAAHSTFQNSTINRFAADAVAGGGTWSADMSYISVLNNTIINAVPAWEVHADTHGDMIQFSSLSKLDTYPIDHLVISGNYVNPFEEYGINPMVSAISNQGITMTNGLLTNALIDNNVVVVNSPHGISIWGAVDSTIINNTIIRARDDVAYQNPTILITRSTGGASTPPSGNVVRNNISPAYTLLNSGWGVADHNLTVVNGENYSNYFTNVSNSSWDVRLKSGAAAIGAGSATLAPATDIAGRTREIPPSIGAYEYIPSGDITPPAAPTGLSVL